MAPHPGKLAETKELLSLVHRNCDKYPSQRAARLAIEHMKEGTRRSLLEIARAH
jgi:hypothetical protein